jgi:hypothetical protein
MNNSSSGIRSHSSCAQSYCRGLSLSCLPRSRVIASRTWSSMLRRPTVDSSSQVPFPAFHLETEHQCTFQCYVSRWGSSDRTEQLKEHAVGELSPSPPRTIFPLAASHCAAKPFEFTTQFKINTSLLQSRVLNRKESALNLAYSKWPAISKRRRFEAHFQSCRSSRSS